MGRQHVVLAIAGYILCTLPVTRALAHPGSGIVVDDRGRVFFTDTGRGVWRVDSGGKLTLISESAMHWMAIDSGRKICRLSGRVRRVVWPFDNTGLHQRLHQLQLLAGCRLQPRHHRLWL
jgi:hypothetical protein